MVKIFESSQSARIFGVPPGPDFAREVVAGIMRRCQSLAPHDLARIEIYVNTARMQKSLIAAFSENAAIITPKISLFTALAESDFEASSNDQISSLKQRLKLAKLISALLDAEPDLAPRSSLFPLADSLARLFDEMEGEQVSFEDLASIDVKDQSGHWQRSLKFLSIIADVASDQNTGEANLRCAVERKIQHWKNAPPSNPILFVGSTASRRTTREFMAEIAHLPQGAVIFPGFDFDLEHGNDSSRQGVLELLSEDHPQFRFIQFLNQVGTDYHAVSHWSNYKGSKRNPLISLSLHPAPVTDEWTKIGPNLGDLDEFTAEMTLLESTSPREEAEAIALGLRAAAAEGKSAALVSPDRNLTRQVSAALDRWDITPDDSAGIPLHLTAPGRLLRQIAEPIGRAMTVEQLFSLLKHPLTHSKREDRGNHLLRARELELEFRRSAHAELDKNFLSAWADERNDQESADWAAWIENIRALLGTATSGTLADLVDQHMDVAEILCGGPNSDASGELWEEAAGRKVRDTVDKLRQSADTEDVLDLQDYKSLFSTVLAGETVSVQNDAHPSIFILGALEARIKSADLVILGGMNEGTWPGSAQPDPWLNRNMRKQLGLLSPDRQVGLSTHDYQQAIAAKEVWITRSQRDADSETVPSRWINRLTNLIQGLPNNNGELALKNMRQRGQQWITHANILNVPDSDLPRASRPSPSPPIEVRPRELSVTRIKTLIRDPFSIYAEKVLRLRSLDPLTLKPEAQLRGIIFHRILELFVENCDDPSDQKAVNQFNEIAERTLRERCPWPAMRVLWRAQLSRIAPKFIIGEISRRANAKVLGTEIRCNAIIGALDFRLHGVADRIDLTEDGQAFLYDYKTGLIPTKPQQEQFDKQLLLEAAMLEMGKFDNIGKLKVVGAEFIGVKDSMASVQAPLDNNPTEKTWSEFTKLIENWNDPNRGYAARLNLFKKDDFSAYDHLSRFGEWSCDEPANLVVLK